MDPSSRALGESNFRHKKALFELDTTVLTPWNQHSHDQHDSHDRSHRIVGDDIRALTFWADALGLETGGGRRTGGAMVGASDKMF